MSHFTSPVPRFLTTLGTVFVAAVVLAACTPAGNNQPSASPSDSSTASDSPSSPSTAPSSTPSGSATASTTGKPSNTSSNASPALCTAAMLSGSIAEGGGGAAGSVYMNLVVKNKTAQPCSINGYPGVSLVGKGNGTQLGAAADRDPNQPSTGAVLLAAGASAAAQLLYTRAENYGASCTLVKADGFRVYPPSATDALYIPNSLNPINACNEKSVVLLHIGAFHQA
ncbi:DUF4232 domain-containing protein [Psychromicrobium lacuslunae]|uniref:DUF4232 domain-containing protein n=1 Tax=Psychromicrobium lacuslunae TaxID=1618207 RepID=UPI0005D2F48A|nr:DUF4232 domain-containing protein [Psychromicrobium lacuslunae]